MKKRRSRDAVERLAAANPIPAGELAALDDGPERDRTYRSIVARRNDAAHGRLAQRKSRRGLLVPAAACALLAAALAAGLLFWPAGGPNGGVLDRARAAVGDGPVFHVVVRGAESQYELVDLGSGKRTPIYRSEEQWYDARRGLRAITRVGGRVVARYVRPPGQITGNERRLFAGILDGYRTALRDGTARVAGEATIDGRRVYWIRLEGEVRRDARGDEHERAQEVAVDADSYKPVAVREIFDGRPAPIPENRIMIVETVPVDAVDFSRGPGDEGPIVGVGVGGTGQFEQVEPQEANRIFGVPALWAGPQLGGLPLARIARYDYRFSSLARYRRTGRLESVPAVNICYGRLRAEDEGVLTKHYCDATAPHVDIHELADADAAAVIADRFEYVPVPQDSLLLLRGGHAGLVHRDGLQIRIRASTDDLVVAAARALRPAGT